MDGKLWLSGERAEDLDEEEDPIASHITPTDISQRAVGVLKKREPFTSGKLNMGTWQGIYLCEFRNHGGCRKIVGTIHE